MESYQETAEDFNEACEAITALLEAEIETIHEIESGYDEEDGDEEMITGPKRIELRLKKKANSSEENRVVVTSVLPPNGRQACTTVVARRWESYGKELGKSMHHFHSHEWCIHELTLYSGEAERSTSFIFKEADNESAWHQLEGAYYKFNQSELTIVRQWTVTSKAVGRHAVNLHEEDEDDLYSTGTTSVHYLNRLPSAYQPHVGSFRVAGDSIGAELFRKQEAERTREPQSLEELLDIEKKLKNEDSSEEESKKKRFQSSRVGPSTPSSGTSEYELSISSPDHGGDLDSREISSHATSVDAKYCDCGNPMCEDCLWTQAVENLGGGVNFKTLH